MVSSIGSIIVDCTCYALIYVKCPIIYGFLDYVQLILLLLILLLLLLLHLFNGLFQDNPVKPVPER